MNILKYILISCLALQAVSCSESILDEKPLDFLVPENSYTTEAGINSSLVNLYSTVRVLNDGKYWTTSYFHFGTDIAYYPTGRGWDSYFNNYGTGLTEMSNPGSYWTKYYALVYDANVIIGRIAAAEYSNEAQRVSDLAEARWFRAYAYRCMVHLYGGVPIVEEEISSPKRDFVRATKEETLNFIIKDLEFAAENLSDISKVADGRVSNVAAYHLLSEIYLAAGDNDNAIAFATKAIDNPSMGLMMNRFGVKSSEEGDPYWDLFQDGNYNRASGNREAIYVIQMDLNTPGGGAESGDMHYNYSGSLSYERNYGPLYFQLSMPDGNFLSQYSGTTQGGGRPVGFITPTDHLANGIWAGEENTDNRTNERNIKRDWEVDNTKSEEWYGKSSADFPQSWKDGLTDEYKSMYYHPMWLKVTTIGEHPDFILLNKETGEMTSNGGVTYHDWYLFRLAETYLIRAEAYLNKGNKAAAAADINMLRTRSGATSVADGDVDIDYILDERMRELNWEEPRRMTLSRLGTEIFKRRVSEYNPVSSRYMEDKHTLFPIPYSEIERNTGAVLEQNPGY